MLSALSDALYITFVKITFRVFIHPYTGDRSCDKPTIFIFFSNFCLQRCWLKQVDPQGVSLLPLPRYAPSPPPTNNRRSFQSLSPLLPAQSNSQYNRARQYCETDASDEKIQRTRLQYDKIRWDWEAFRSGEHGTYLVQSVAALLARLI